MIQTYCYSSQSRCASYLQDVSCYWLTDGNMCLNGLAGPPWRGPLRILLCAHCRLSEVISGLSAWSREEVQGIQIRSIQQHFFRTVTLLWITALHCLRGGERVHESSTLLCRVPANRPVVRRRFFRHFHWLTNWIQTHVLGNVIIWVTAIR